MPEHPASTFEPTPQTSRCWTAEARRSGLSSSRSASGSGSRPRTHSEHRSRSVNADGLDRSSAFVSRRMTATPGAHRLPGAECAYLGRLRRDRTPASAQAARRASSAVRRQRRSGKLAYTRSGLVGATSGSADERKLHGLIILHVIAYSLLY